MQTNNTRTFIEMLRHQIKEEQRKYHTALSNEEIWELKLIKDNIRKLQSRLERFMNNIPGYSSKENS